MPVSSRGDDDGVPGLDDGVRTGLDGVVGDEDGWLSVPGE
jgi:hypothetical protein